MSKIVTSYCLKMYTRLDMNGRIKVHVFDTSHTINKHVPCFKDGTYKELKT